jgi:hypothetical protein
MSAAVPSGWDRRRNLLLGKCERIALEQFAWMRGVVVAVSAARPR